MTKTSFYHWLYSGGRPNRLAKVMNRIAAALHSTGIFPDYMVTLEVIGRKSGKTITLPLVMVVLNGQRYLASMLGTNVQWVLNVRATGGKAVIHCGGREEVQLVEVPAGERAPILKLYLQRAPGARPHVSVDKDAPLSEFEKIADTLPVFRVMTAG